MSADDTRVRLVAGLDQLGAALRDFAPVLGSYRRELEQQGFLRPEALALVVALQTSWLRLAADRGRGDPDTA